MREIKFRAWDKERKRIVKVLSVEYNYCYKVKRIKAYCEQIADYFLFESEFQLMQYTELKDKNGKEIYEGDIIESSKTGIHFVIKWFNANCQYGGTNGRIWFDPERFNDSLIIGNIYENPELLEEKI